MDQHFHFEPPPEAPVYEPTEEEFQDPLAFIAKIRPQAMKSGICKIRPPKNWQPPFAVDIDSFKFKARVQRLYELEAQSRVKFNFILKLSQFMKLQGREKLRIPNVYGRYLDLHSLHKMVGEAGGYMAVCSSRKWVQIGNRLGYNGTKVAFAIKNHYDKILLPYDFMLNGAAKEAEKYKELISKGERKVPISPKPAMKRQRKSHITGVQDVCVDEINYTVNKEMRKLQFFGPGPKAAVPGTSVKEEASDENQDSLSMVINSVLDETPERQKTGTKRKAPIEPELVKKVNPRDKQLEDYICHVCNSGEDENMLLICDTVDCQDCYHTYCLIPPLPGVPKEVWKCPRCVIQTCQKPPEEFGFPESANSYTLAEFGQRADQFKANYFDKPAYMVTCSEVESEFWRILQAFNDDVVVEYGADIHSSKTGSGFPTIEGLAKWKTRQGKVDVAKRYAESPWNLNVLPILHKSVLRFINADISGMKVPWCYVGMTFSSFCWHIEDHWSYSINYLHWGEPKTWYGVSGEQAELFEYAMRKQVPELFEQAPDLLHHITTIMNPNVLQKEGVNVVRTNQCAGEFVVTFPRAYHAGFNQGFNFAEAVNFCPADWMPIGHDCIDHYVDLRRFCVFSHDELLCSMALANKEDSGALDLNMREMLYAELLRMVKREKESRSRLIQKGLRVTDQVNFEDLNDDDRICDVCNTTCFVSALTCPCGKPNEDGDMEMDPSKQKERMVCLQHSDELCTCEWSNRTLKYRYTPAELNGFLSTLEDQLKDYKEWVSTFEHLVSNQRSPSPVPKPDAGATSIDPVIVKIEETEFTSDNAMEIDSKEKCSSILLEAATKSTEDEEKETNVVKMDTKKEVKSVETKEKCSLYELQMQLELGRSEGYAVTQVFRDLEDLSQRADQLSELCTKFISGLKGETLPVVDGESITTSLLPEVAGGPPTKRQIHLRRLTLHDLTSLVTAVNALPLTGVGDSSVSELSRVITRIPSWQLEVDSLLADVTVKQYPVVEALCREATGFRMPLPQMEPLAKLGKGLSWCFHVDGLFPDLAQLDGPTDARRSVRRAGQLKREAGISPSIPTQPLVQPEEPQKPEALPTRAAPKRLPTMKALQQVISAGKDLLKTFGEEDKRLHSLCARLHIRLGALHSKMTRAEKTRVEMKAMLEDKQYDYDDLVSVSAECQNLGVYLAELGKLKEGCWSLWSREAVEMRTDDKRLMRTFTLTWFEKLLNLGMQLCTEGVIQTSDAHNEAAKNLKFTHDMVRLAHRLRAKVAAEFLLQSPNTLGPAADIRLLQVMLPRVVDNEMATKNLMSQFVDAVENLDPLESPANATKEILTFYLNSVDCEKRSVVPPIADVSSTLLAAQSRLSSPPDLRNGPSQCALCLQELDKDSLYYMQRQTQPDAIDTTKYVGPQLCSKCQRTKRPSLSVLVSLNAKMAHLPLRTYEAFALQGLTKRVLFWLEEVERTLRVHPRCLWPLVHNLHSSHVFVVPHPLLSACSQQSTKTSIREDGSVSNNNALESIDNLGTNSSDDVTCSPMTCKDSVVTVLARLLNEGFLLEVNLSDYWRLLERLIVEVNCPDGYLSVLPSKSQNCDSLDVMKPKAHCDDVVDLDDSQNIENEVLEILDDTHETQSTQASSVVEILDDSDCCEIGVSSASLDESNLSTNNQPATL